jgi:hypothetical protein
VYTFGIEGVIQVKDMIMKKKDGQISFVNIDPSQSNKLSDGSVVHLCWGNCKEHIPVCKNASPSKCIKVAVRNKNLEDYDFITDGIQTLDGTIVVRKCMNYEPAGERKLTKEERNRIKSAHRGMVTGFFGTDSVEEAAVVHYMSMVNGENTTSTDTILPEITIIDIISNMRNAEEMLFKVLEYKENQREKADKRTSIKKIDKTIEHVESTLSKIINKRIEEEKTHDEEIKRLIKRGSK